MLIFYIKRIDNWFGDEGATFLSDALKVNSSLKVLNLSGLMMRIKCVPKTAFFFCELVDGIEFAENEIKTEGAKALFESLKLNSSLTELKLKCMGNG